MIPKIIHQIWIGTKPSPSKLMETWKTKHPDFEYIFWNEKEFEKREILFESQDKIDLISEINGKADIIRWELLYKFGGVFIDADSICIEPIDDYFMTKTAFASYENETVRKGLVATGTMGFPPKHPLCRDIIDWIKSDVSTPYIIEKKAWFSVGPGLLTRFLNSGKYSDFTVFPSHVFLPVHFEGIQYNGHKKVYAHQFWGSNYQLYDSNFFYKTEIFEVPISLKTPEKWISILLFYNDSISLSKLNECLNSIRCLKGYFGIEIIWLYEKTDDIHSLLETFLKTSRFTTISWKMNEFSQNFIYFMDINYVMRNDRIQKQMNFLENNPDKMVCSSLLLHKNQVISSNEKTSLCFRDIKDIHKEECIDCLPETLIISI